MFKGCVFCLCWEILEAIVEKVMGQTWLERSGHVRRAEVFIHSHFAKTTQKGLSAAWGKSDCGGQPVLSVSLFLSMINWNHGLKVERWMSPIVEEPDWKLWHILSKWLRWLSIYTDQIQAFDLARIFTCWGSQGKTPNVRLSSLLKYFT